MFPGSPRSVNVGVFFQGKSMADARDNSGSTRIAHGWCHCIESTYGSWLPGDPRGFRTRHQRETIRGDYKAPPPEGIYERRHDMSRSLTDGETVILSHDARGVVLEQVKTTLILYKVPLRVICVAATHMHLLAQFPDRLHRTRGGAPSPSQSDAAPRTSAIDDPVRHLMGQAKQWSSKAVVRAALASHSIWAKRGAIVRVNDANHLENVVRYILDHEEQGATVWDAERHGDSSADA